MSTRLPLYHSLARGSSPEVESVPSRRVDPIGHTSPSPDDAGAGAGVADPMGTRAEPVVLVTTTRSRSWSSALAGQITRIFPSLAYRDYRLLWQGNLGTFLAFMMQFTVEGWLVYELTGSPFYLSFLALCRSVPILIVSPVAGVVADRADRRLILVSAQFVALGSAMGIGAMILVGRLEAWHLLAAAAISGSAMGMFVPARQAMTTELVPRRHLMDAFSVHATSVGGVRIVGPQIAGVLLALSGAALCYAVQIAGYAWGIANQLQIRSTVAPDTDGREGFFESFLGGFKYAIRNGRVRAVLVVMLVWSVMLYPYMQFLPVFASDVLDIGASGLGMLLASIGMGALVGSLLAGRLGRIRRKGLLMLGACLAIGLLVVVFAQSRWVWLSMLSLFGAGAGGGIVQVISLTAAQTLVPDSYRGRIGSIDMTIWGLMPLGTVPIGLIAGMVGIGTGLAIWAGLGTFTVVALGAFLPSLRRLEC